MKKRKGFTLIELLIVVAIIAILAAIAVPNFLEAQTRSKTSRCKADMRSITTALESYFVDNNEYPPAGDYGAPNPRTGAGFHSRIPTYLTTPIAYLTSIEVAYDPFVVRESTWYSSYYPRDTRVGERYVYYNSKFHAEDWGDVWGGLYNWVGAWLFYGYGPDKTPFHGPKGTLIPYDPTNGTVSLGNIIRCQKMTDGIPPHPVTGTYHWP
ncbi:prepilin-type N-terminal cleavage/methylation domain-containing protein [Candidatus Sumerlaeota bacterium]|nr:prepilin-type N-terminal cleavage/methylation domain-containing protein [Candidatus Sumerlaeota bacterium]